MAGNRAIVYIDGENFIHRIEDALKAKKFIKKKEEITHFAVRELLKPILSEYKKLEIRYYGTKIRLHDISDPKVLEHAKVMVESQRRFKRNLLNQNIEFIVAGSLRVREVLCYKCKKMNLVFKEKGVDVRLAVDLVGEAKPKVTQVVVSSDSDLLPAIIVAKQQKSRIIYLHHAEQPNYAMIKASDEERVFTTRQIYDSYIAANRMKRKK